MGVTHNEEIPSTTPIITLYDLNPIYVNIRYIMKQIKLLRTSIPQCYTLIDRTVLNITTSWFAPSLS